MAQHDMNIANQGFPATRADLNNALQALVSNSSGTSAPSTTFANQWWYDTTNNKMYIRNEANNAWIEVFTLDQTNNEWQLTTGVVQAKDSDGLALKTDDGTTRLFIKDSDGHIGLHTTSPDGSYVMTVETSSSVGGIRVQGDSARYAAFENGSETIGDGPNFYLQNVSGGTYAASMQMGPTSEIIFFQYPNSGAWNERMRIDFNGNVGIQTNNPQQLLHLTSTAAAIQVEGTTRGDIILVDSNAPSNEKRKVVRCDGGILGFGTENDAITSYSEHMRIESDGDVKIATTSNPMPLGEQRLTLDTGGGSRNGIGVSQLGSGFIGLTTRPSANHTYYAGYWLNSGGSAVGSISVSNTATTYSTSSDYRLKENVTDVTDGITRVKQLSPKRFNFIADADTTVDGFLAHEAATVVPEAVNGEKDAMRDEEYEVSAATGDIYTPATEEAEEVIHSSNVEQPETLEDGQEWRETTAAVMDTRSVPDYQGIDQSKLVPLLTAALQEAIAKIEALETRVAALEG